MKIAFLSTFYPYRGGIAQFNASLYREFEKEHEVKAFTFTRQYPNILFPGKSQMIEGSDNADKIPSVRTLDSINPLTFLSTAKKINEFKPDIFLLKFWIPFLAPSLGAVCKRVKRNGTKVITILDNVIPHEKRTGDIAVTKYFLRQNSGFIVMSDIVKNDLLKLKPDAKYSFQPHPLYDHFGDKLNQSEAKQKLGIPDNKKVLLFFGFIRDYKGLDLLIDAMKQLDDSYVLLIAGEVYGNFDKYQSQIENEGLQNKIKLFIRYIPDSEVPLFFSASDVCILPYRSATQSGIISMAYHFEMPVIATDVGGLSEMIDNEKTGIIVKKPNPGDIAAGVIKLFSLDLNSVRNNINKLKSKYSWHSFTEAIVNLYNKIL